MGRRRAEVLAEDTGEMRLIGKTGLRRDFGQGVFSLENQLLGIPQPGIDLPLVRGNAGGGFLSFGKPKGIDLDLGCLFELQNGYKGVVQALGNAFGDYRDEPYIELMGDDRTGAVSDGEWLRINGAEWKEVKRIVVFAYIYDGAPNWSATDGVVTLYAPGQPPIEVRLNEEGGRFGMCAVALLENVGGAVKVSREIKFVKGHLELDKAYGWGMRWSAGSK